MAPKVVLITGCSEGGIGYAFAEAFALAGCTVYASARRTSTLENLPASIHRLTLDVVKISDCQTAVDQIISEQGRIDILVNNAGMGGTGALADFNVEDAKNYVFEANVFAPLRLSQMVIPHMAKEKTGLIINVGSIVGNIATPWAGVYSASKAALHSLTDTLRMETKGFGLHVMLVAPGAITSGFGKKQADSLKMPEGSLYRSVKPFIDARATMSQRADHTMPASTLAAGVVKRALQSPPAVYYTAGGKSLLFWILERLPKRFVWWALARVLGTNKVGL